MFYGPATGLVASHVGHAVIPVSVRPLPKPHPSRPPAHRRGRELELAMPAFRGVAHPSSNYQVIDANRPVGVSGLVAIRAMPAGAPARVARPGVTQQVAPRPAPRMEAPPPPPVVRETPRAGYPPAPRPEPAEEPAAPVPGHSNFGTEYVPREPRSVERTRAPHAVEAPRGALPPPAAKPAPVPPKKEK